MSEHSASEKAPTVGGGARAEATSRLERALAALGRMLLAALLGYLVYYGLTRDDGPR